MIINFDKNNSKKYYKKSKYILKTLNKLLIISEIFFKIKRKSIMNSNSRNLKYFIKDFKTRYFKKRDLFNIINKNKTKHLKSNKFLNLKKKFNKKRFGRKKKRF